MSSPRPELRLDWCSHAAAKYAVEKWHYSRVLPTPPYVRLGIWEDDQYRGCVLFSRGAVQHHGKAFGLTVTEVAELTRVALSSHQTAVSRIVSIAVKMLRKRCPGLRLLISYADPDEGHHGGIYQAAGWVYVGQREPSTEYITPTGKRQHARMVSPLGFKRVYGRPRAVLRPDQCTAVTRAGKLKYLYPLDDAMRAQIAPLARPYPKRPQHQGDATVDQAAEGGSIPTRTLHEAAV